MITNEEADLLVDMFDIDYLLKVDHHENLLDCETKLLFLKLIEMAEKHRSEGK